MWSAAAPLNPEIDRVRLELAAALANLLAGAPASAYGAGQLGGTTTPLAGVAPVGHGDEADV